MISKWWSIPILAGLLIAQVTVIPAFIVDPFKPTLLLVAVVRLALRAAQQRGGGRALALGLLQDCFSGETFGLNAFSFLVIHTILKSLSARLYADSFYLTTMVVFVATILNGLIHLVLLSLFSVSPGVYATILTTLIPQALVNALAASLWTTIFFRRREEGV